MRAIMEEQPWRRNHEGEIREEESSREIMEEKSGRRNCGGHLVAEVSRRHRYMRCQVYEKVYMFIYLYHDIPIILLHIL